MNLLHANDRQGEYPPSWYAATAPLLPPQPPLRGHVRAEVAIVGAGYTGLSAALALAGRGYRVVVLEAQRIGFGASGRNGGQVGTGHRLDQEALEAQYGPDKARALWEIAEEAKAEVARLLSSHLIEAEYRPGVAYLARRVRDVQAGHLHADWLARRYGYGALDPLDRAGAQAATGAEGYAGGVLDRGAGHLHPLKFALGLAQAALRAGVTICEQSEVTRLEAGPPARLVTRQGEVQAAHVVLAANGYLGGLEPGIAARVMPINSCIVATEPLADATILPEGIAAADDRFVTQYWRKTPDHRLLFGGVETYGYRFPRDIAAAVAGPMARVYPQLRDTRITHAWGGTLAITASRMPYFARPAPHILSASGYSGQGLALSTLAGRLMADAIAAQAEKFDLMASLPAARFPGGIRGRPALLLLAMSWYAMRDRLGI